MNEIENYKNLIILMKKTLEFYANGNNYIVNNSIGGELFSMISTDGGSQAKFVLKLVDDLENTSKKMEDEYINEIAQLNSNSLMDESNYSTDEMLEMLNELKNLSNELIKKSE